MSALLRGAVAVRTAALVCASTAAAMTPAPVVAKTATLKTTPEARLGDTMTEATQPRPCAFPVSCAVSQSEVVLFFALFSFFLSL